MNEQLQILSEKVSQLEALIQKLAPEVHQMKTEVQKMKFEVQKISRLEAHFQALKQRTVQIENAQGKLQQSRAKHKHEALESICNSLSTVMVQQGLLSSDLTACCIINISLQCTTNFGERVFLVGETDLLGGWDPGKAIALDSDSSPFWNKRLIVPLESSSGQILTFKFIKIHTDGSVEWEEGNNRTLQVKEGERRNYPSTWNSC